MRQQGRKAVMGSWVSMGSVHRQQSCREGLRALRVRSGDKSAIDFRWHK